MYLSLASSRHGRPSVGASSASPSGWSTCRRLAMHLQGFLYREYRDYGILYIYI